MSERPAKGYHPVRREQSFQHLKPQILENLKRGRKEHKNLVKKAAGGGEGEGWLNTNLVVCGVLIRRLTEMNRSPVLM